MIPGQIKEERGEEEIEGEGDGEEEYMDGEDDWYYAMSRMAQTSLTKEASKLNQEVSICFSISIICRALRKLLIKMFVLTQIDEIKVSAAPLFERITYLLQKITSVSNS